MILALFGFLNISLADVVDIVLVAAIIYLLFRWIRGSSAMSIFIAILSLYVIRIAASVLNMKMLSALMGTILDVGVLALIVIFQPEIRRFLIRLGDRYRAASEGSNFLGKLLNRGESGLTDASSKEITEACWNMAAEKTGALIVIQHGASLGDILETGDSIDAVISRRLIQNIFFKNSPLHDGAMVIGRERIIAARCTLPITTQTDIPAEYGMRHKAAIGMSETSDADVLVVSEETGGISFARGGTIMKITGHNQLKLVLEGSMSSKKKEGK